MATGTLVPQTTSQHPTVDVFVSYSRTDKFWKDWLLGGHLSAGSVTFRFWSDDEIRPSDDWSKEIEMALETARVVVFLVSASFLESDFIRKIEVSKSLAKRKSDGAKILWVPLESPGSLKKTKLFKKIELSKIQAVWPVDSPLKHILENEPPVVLEAARDQIHDHILQAIDPELWRVRHALREQHNKHEILERLDEGTCRTVYLGRDHALKRFVSIVTLKRREDLEDFRNSLRRASQVEDLECFMTVYEASLSEEPPYYIGQYVEGQSLAKLLRHGRLTFRHAREILLRIGHAIDAAHRRDFFHLNIKPSNIMIDGRDKVYLSALSRRSGYFEWLMEHWGETGRDCPGKEDQAYAIPEFFQDQVVPKESFGKCDQYLLGLLGYHMIAGTLPTAADDKRAPKSPADFLDLKPIREVEHCKLCPQALADSIMRMVSREPKARFENVAEALRPLEQTGQESLTLAKESYRRVASVESRISKVFEEFYQRFRGQSMSGAREMFDRMDWTLQYEMLKEAVLLLLVFCEFDAPAPKEPTVLSRIATKHSKLDLAGSDFNLFQTLLIQAFIDNDPDCKDSAEMSAEVKQAWQESLKPGIDFMRRHASSFENRQATQV
jgi:serine/threonine protein kinase